MGMVISPYRFAAAGGGAGAHRYWRINSTANGGATETAIVELQMYESEFGPNVCTGGTASASSNLTGYGPEDAFDGFLGDTGTSSSIISAWAGATNAEWLAYDFGLGNDKEIVAIGIHGRQSAWTTQMPTAFSVQYSDNGSTWTTAWSESGLSWSAREFKRFVDPGYTEPSYTGSPWGTHVYWRLCIMEPISGAVAPAIAEVENRATPGGADQTSGGTATAESIFSGSFPASNAFDGNASTLWSSANTSGPRAFTWVQYQHSSAVSWAQLVLKARNDTAANTSPANIAWQFADSSSGPWTTVMVQNGLAAWSLGETRTYTDPNYI